MGETAFGRRLRICRAAVLIGLLLSFGGCTNGVGNSNGNTDNDKNGGFYGGMTGGGVGLP
jgi:hypothetical protein